MHISPGGDEFLVALAQPANLSLHFLTRALHFLHNLTGVSALGKSALRASEMHSLANARRGQKNSLSGVQSSAGASAAAFP